MKKKSQESMHRRRDNPSTEVQFFAQREALPESPQFLQEKSVAKCHTMVQKSTAQIQCRFNVQKKFWLLLFGSRSFLYELP